MLWAGGTEEDNEAGRGGLAGDPGERLGHMRGEAQRRTETSLGGSVGGTVQGRGLGGRELWGAWDTTEAGSALFTSRPVSSSALVTLGAAWLGRPRHAGLLTPSMWKSSQLSRI